MDILSDTIQRATEIGVPLITRVPSVSSIVCTILALLGGVLGYFYGPYWSVRQVPGPPTMPFVGHLPLFAKYGTDLFSVLAKRYGPIYRFHMGRQPLIIIASPELCKEVGIKKFKDFANRSIPSPIASSPLHQKGLFFTRDSRWTSMRNTVVSIYQPSHLASLVPMMQAYIEATAENIESNKSKDFIFSDVSLQMANDVIGQAAFGVDFGLSKPKSLHDKLKHDDNVQSFIKQHIYSTTKLKMDLTGSFSIILGLIAPILQEPVRQIMKRIPFTMDWRFDRINQSLSTQLDGIVTKRMKETNADSKNLLSLILKKRDSEETTRNIFTPDYISAVAFEHLLAGSTTTSFTLSSALYLISQHFAVEKKLIEEIDGFGPHDQLPTAEDLQNKFPYLDQVVKETLRFYLVSPLIARIAAKDVEIGGYLLPKGTWVWLAPGVLAKDPKNFPEPEKFKPERFDPKGEEEKQRHPYAHIPFGLGPRSCIGQKFSIQEIKLSLIHLYRKFIFRHSPDMESPLELEFGIVLNFRHGVKLRAIKREEKKVTRQIW